MQEAARRSLPYDSTDYDSTGLVKCFFLLLLFGHVGASLVLLFAPTKIHKSGAKNRLAEDVFSPHHGCRGVIFAGDQERGGRSSGGYTTDNH